MNFGLGLSYVALWAMLLFQGLLALALLRRVAELRELASHGVFPTDGSLEVGSSAPEFQSVDYRSRRQISNTQFAERERLILFLSACPACMQLADELRQVRHLDLPPIVVFCLGGERSCSGIIEKLAPEICAITEDAEEIAARFRIAGTPTAVAVDSENIIQGYGHARAVKDLQELLVQSRLPPLEMAAS